jgi:hypothetical protein
MAAKGKIELDLSKVQFKSYISEDKFVEDPEEWLTAIIRNFHEQSASNESLRRENGTLRHEVSELERRVELMVQANASIPKLKGALEGVLPSLYELIDAHDLKNGTLQRQAVQDLARTVHNWIVDELTCTPEVD